MDLSAPLKSAAELSNAYWSNWHQRQDLILYHYTDAAGLSGILSSGELWLTSTPYLNDATENRHAGVIIRRALEQVHALQLPERQVRFYRHLNEVFESVENAPRLSIDKQTFVCCFSSKQDSLSQWRAYGGGEGGFAIGFRAAEIWDLKGKNDLSPGFWLLPCAYNEAWATELNREYLIRAVDECLARNAGASDEAIAAAIARDASWMGAAIKHPAFVEESEWRLIFYGFGLPASSVFYRANRTLTPYKKFSSSEPGGLLGAIAEVWVGPQRHPELAASALADLLLSKTGKQVPVRVTSTPFRVV